MRDPYTTGHHRRVADLARAVADRLGIRKDQVDTIRMAASIHDIGRIAIPSDILSKPGHLNDFEFELVKTHPRLGFDILKQIDFPGPVALTVLQHHERLDGSGYPQGLRGEEIILEARVLGVADVVETMVSHRPHRSALDIEQALGEVSRNRGVLYDPEVVDACVALFRGKSYSFKVS
jgi:HD-GYP domain-containing protein (c-di-GMP phosphodiesterase class II)